MHWFWRATISLLTGGLLYVLCATGRLIPSGVPFYWARFLFQSAVFTFGSTKALLLLHASAIIVAAFVYTVLSKVFPIRDGDGRHCVVCGYDLTGNITAVCPECGAGVSVVFLADHHLTEPRC